MWLPKSKVIRYLALAACFFAVGAAGVLCATPLSASTGHCAAGDSAAVWCGSVETHRAIVGGAILDIFFLALLALAAAFLGSVYTQQPGAVFAVAVPAVRLWQPPARSYLEILFSRGILHPRNP